MKRVTLLTLLLLLITVAAVAQCSMCRAVATSGTANGQNTAGGINSAILYMMVFPYALLFIFFRKKIFGFLKELRGLWR
ncbi:MAG TPA: hypothetical protein VFU15_00075 [Bacteroidia bacterium]|nr:hypothetical protein [Bacteroidia bacterium]